MHAVENHPIDRTNMLQYGGRLRRFTPQELLMLFGFPKSFEFPPGISQDHQYRLVGNSINVVVLAELLKVLLLPDLNSETTNWDSEESAAAVVVGGVQQQLIGGIKGHVEENISGTLLRLYQAYRWKPLPNCTGRYTCREHNVVSTLSPLELLDRAAIKSFDDGESRILSLFAFDLPGRPDRVLVVPLDRCNRTGVITFAKTHETHDGSFTSYVHTLNAPSGFRRKLNGIGIQGVTEEDIRIAL
jgi:hypothetical protein